jgi:hypothetical protein
MTNRVSPPPQDFHKMCKQAERDQESRKLAILMDRVKRQIAERDGAENSTKRPAIPIREAVSAKLPSRSGLFER